MNFRLTFAGLVGAALLAVHGQAMAVPFEGTVITNENAPPGFFQSVGFSVIHANDSATDKSGVQKYAIDTQAISYDWTLIDPLQGSQLTFDDVVLDLRGINGSSGNTGTLTLNGTLTVGGLGNFGSLNWDRNGGADGDESDDVTPTNVIGGNIDYAISTTGGTDASGTIQFRPIVEFRPFNGIYHDDEGLTTWLWGGTLNQIGSNEFNHFGIDLAFHGVGVNVPVGGLAWLFGIGLLGLMVAGRRHALK